ncbi:MAG: cob(I)yrinic acid a,c-diamide adenosyltransferase [Muribaculaceae bacterium]|nr:cob(I)yrinic acid a,c-diamide adenosyltransferase [Muribaculaceae bacterium]
MAKSRIYTRTGDGILTSIIGGDRIPKYSLRLEAYGTVDELSAFIGNLVADDSVIDQQRVDLLKVQNMLFNIGGYLATPPAVRKKEVAGLTQDNISEMETWIDEMDQQLPPLNNFIIPGGCKASAKANVARTVCRRAERRILQLAAEEEINLLIMAYINRLSDYLFVIGRYLNKFANFEEIEWQKPENL